MKIDWNEAPEWAVGHGLVVMGAIKQVWYGEQAYMVIGDSRSYCYGGGDGETRHNHLPNAIQFKTLRPAPWTGEGLPPAGIECMVYDGVIAGAKVKILAHDGCLAVFSHEGEYKGRTAHAFRPIRTPEQIAAEDRATSVQEMVNSCPYPGSAMTAIDCLALYKAGYRKQVKHDL